MIRKTKKREKRGENKTEDINNMSGSVVEHVYNPNPWEVEGS